MPPFDFGLLLLAAAFLLLLALLVFFAAKSRKLEQQLSDVVFAKSSQSVKYGKLTEQWIPFSARFPHDPKRFRFLGCPIDGVVFDDDKIVFVEFKTASSRLNENQQKIKRLVQNKKVDWLEFKIK